MSIYFDGIDSECKFEISKVKLKWYRVGKLILDDLTRSALKIIDHHLWFWLGYTSKLPAQRRLTHFFISGKRRNPFWPFFTREEFKFIPI